ncbi:MAG: hypothetical protein ISR51_07610 [Rhodospirillales bacterium]|nr:hypothetical protein [Alphaproteobacteria bacterium]MBL6948528.1 hypothetical protein [Rhodospirillales bacterium]
MYLQKRPCYTLRIERYHDDFIDKHTPIETVMIPCSSDDETINFGFGMVKYTYSKEKAPPDYGPKFSLL